METAAGRRSLGAGYPGRDCRRADLPTDQPGREHFDFGQRRLFEAEHLDAESCTCLTGTSDRLDSGRRVPAASANIADSNGGKLAEQTGAIVVAANYRLGPFGFLGHPALMAENPVYLSSGNYGFLDQRAALAWVRDHVAAFGGDSTNVTIDGHSAGGHSVSLHVMSPGAVTILTARSCRAGTRRAGGRRSPTPNRLAMISPRPLDVRTHRKCSLVSVR